MGFIRVGLLMVGMLLAWGAMRPLFLGEPVENHVMSWAANLAARG